MIGRLRMSALRSAVFCGSIIFRAWRLWPFIVHTPHIGIRHLSIATCLGRSRAAGTPKMDTKPSLGGIYVGQDADDRLAKDTDAMRTSLVLVIGRSET